MPIQSNDGEGEPQPTKAEIAAQVGISERHLYVVLDRGTASPSLADKLARFNGGKRSDYLRSRYKPGRVRSFPFQEFVTETVKSHSENESRAIAVIWKFHGTYLGWPQNFRRKPPIDFENLSAMFTYAAACEMTIEERDALPAIDRLFRKWRIDKQAEHKRFEIDMEEEGLPPEWASRFRGEDDFG